MTRARWLSLVSTTSIILFLLSSTALGEVSSAAPFDYTLTNEGGMRFADEYQRLGGVNTLGYPASHRFVLADGFTYQLTQGALLQWWPERDGVMLANIFEMLENAGIDDWLYHFKGIPQPIKNDGSGGDWNKARDIRLGWLTNEAIKARYLANPNPGAIASWNVDRSIELYRLPMSYPERFGPFITQRFQRIAFQLWVEEVPGMPPPGSVVRVLGGDLMKEAGLIPLDALAAGDRPTPTPTPTPMLVPPTPVPPELTVTPTPRPVPTPDPNHPPQTGTFTGYWDDRSPGVWGEHEILVRQGYCGGRGSSGPFMNLPFTEEYVGKVLTVTFVEKACWPGHSACQTPLVYLINSWIGEVQERATFNLYTGTHWPWEDCFDGELVSGGGLSLQWTIHYGQYVLFWGAREWSSAIPDWTSPPFSVTCTVSIN